MADNIREIVLDTLLTLERENKKSHLLIREVLDKYDYLDTRDKAFFKRLSEGTISYTITLDYILNKYSSKPIEKCKPVIRALLRMSAYQILFMDKVPDSAVCDEAVKLCRKKSFEAFTPFVNGVLRNISKEKEKALDFSNITDEITRLSLQYAMPEWLVRMFKKEQPDVEALLKGLIRIRPTCVRIVDLSQKNVLLTKWKEMGIKVSESKYLEDAYLIEGFDGMESLPGFSEGMVIVQDESSMLAAKATGIEKGASLRVMDVCAAPGGKTSYVASKMQPNGKVLSFDVSENKVELIRENVNRLSLENVEANVLDATEFKEEYLESADVVIADVPCSGLGIMARKSDIKLNITNEAMKEICDLQKKIISNVSRYVKKGGVLIYSTCTIHKAENEKMVKFILDNLPFEGDSLKPYLPKVFEVERQNEYSVQLLPNVDETDGFFVARFIKKAD